MLHTIIPFAVTILITVSFCVLARRPFGECIVSTFYSLSVIMYLSQYLLGSFSPGLYLIIILAVSAAALIFLRNGGAVKNSRFILTGGFFAFLGCFILVSIMDAGRKFYSWDELMHWGKMVKEMLRLDKFYCVTESTLYRHKDYPPFIALLEYTWCRLGGGYSEPHVAQSLHLLNVSLVVPVLFEQFRVRAMNLKKAAGFVVKGILAAAIALIVCSFCDPNTNINSIYEDLTIALMFSYSAFLVYRKQYRTRWGCFCYALSLVALIGTKQVGIAFIGLSLLYLLMSALFLSEEPAQKTRGILCAAVSGAAALIYYKSWDLVVNRYYDMEARQFDLGSNISISGFLKALTDSSDRTHRDMLKRFIFALFEKNIASAPIAITFFTSFLIVLLVLAGLLYLFRDRFSRREQVILGTVFVVGELGYAVMMLMLYELCFESEEMQSMHSFPRYMGSYFLAALMLLLCIFVWLRGRKTPVWQKTSSMWIAFMLAAVLIVPGKLSFLIPQGLHGDTLINSRGRGAYISENVRDGSTIYLAYERTNGDYEQIMYSYFVDGAYIDHTYYNMAEEVPSDKLEYTFGEDDYVYTISVTEGINKALSPYNGGAALKNFTLYEIVKSDGTISLKEIGSAG